MTFQKKEQPKPDTTQKKDGIGAATTAPAVNNDVQTKKMADEINLYKKKAADSEKKVVCLVIYFYCLKFICGINMAKKLNVKKLEF